MQRREPVSVHRLSAPAQFLRPRNDQPVPCDDLFEFEDQSSDGIFRSGIVTARKSTGRSAESENEGENEHTTGTETNTTHNPSCLPALAGLFGGRPLTRGVTELALMPPLGVQGIAQKIGLRGSATQPDSVLLSDQARSFQSRA